MPPPPVIMEVNASETVSVSLGMAQVFDVADLRPTITNDAPEQFTQGVYRINWQATDFSKNVSEATKDTVQIVNLKEPGTNKLPIAFDQVGTDAIEATSYEPISITVRGQDGNAVPDPLWFSIEQQPENGFFIAPLYPYFIDDYRMTARYSPQIAATKGESFAWELAADPQKMLDYVKELCEEDIRRTDLPKDFVSLNPGSEYMAVDDDGYTYIYDSYYKKCSHGGSTVSPNGPPRISLWDPEGAFVGSIDISNSSTPVTDIKFDLGRGYIFVVTNNSASNFSYITLYRINRDNSAEPFELINSFDLMNQIEDTPDNRRFQFHDANSAVLDSNGVLYVLSRAPEQGLAVFQLTGDERKPLRLMTHLVENIVNRYDNAGIDLRFLSNLALDSENNLYFFALHDTLPDGRRIRTARIYKFGAAKVNDDGTIQPGEFIGWLGKCDSGPDCDYINQRSIGYSCTDATCLIDEGSSGTGTRAGQFGGTDVSYKNVAIAIDPNDVLYITDYENQRVQRFSPEGYFAGDATSTGDGSGFVLGDFGRPDNIADNKSSFYVMDGYNEIVHVFDAAVIHGIDERSAWVEYQSENNFVGTDRFTFSATDGFRTRDGDLLSSRPATVEINVSRNFRPPKATAGLAISMTEDMPANLVLSGYDLDEDLDTLTFQVDSQPTEGTLTGTAPNLTYTPRADYAGIDRFTFTVSDGRFTSEPEEFVIDILPVNDPPTISSSTTSLKAGVGYPLVFDATIIDAEIEDPLTVQVNWGDGVVENQGEPREDGTVTGPLLEESGTVTRTLRGAHVYNNPGPVQLVATVTDSAGAQARVTLPVTVEAMADLAIERRGTNAVSLARSALSYELAIINRAPESGGTIGTGIVVKESLGDGLTYRLATTNSGICNASGQTLNCTLDPLASDATTLIRIVVDAATSLAIGEERASRAEVNATQSDPFPENNIAEESITMLPVADFLVDSFREGNDAQPGDGLCLTSDGQCTVRAAVQEANALPGKQSIALGRETYALNLDANTVLAAYFGAVDLTPEDASLTGDLDVTDDLEIIGLNAEETILNANDHDRVIEVLNGATLTLRDLTLTGGAALNDDDGGGLRNVGSTVILHNVSVNSNRAGSGGGIQNQGNLTLENVTISGNQAGTGGGLQALGGDAFLQNVTMMGNTASSAGGGINSGNGNDVRLVSTILVGNAAPIGPNCGASFRSEGHNLLDILSDCSVLGETTTNIIASNALDSMSTLIRNQSSTHQHEMTTANPAVDRGRCDLSRDQRGTKRPQGDGCDIGAVELLESIDEPEPEPNPGGQRVVFLPFVTR
ncbi:hypothetical protein KFU94_40095 [Chloroflexi bacterium TSY]|nr:hypothetical protein [Chloroflexi bacterium TSY]